MPCSPDWSAQAGNNLVIAVTGPADWASVAGDNLIISVECPATAPDVLLGVSNGYTGEVSDAAVLGNILIAANAYTGETSDTVLDTRIQILFVSDAYTGEASDVLLITLKVFEPIAYTGEELTSVLTTFPVQLLPVDAYTGENITAAVQSSVILNVDFYTGEESTAILTTLPNLGMETIANTGEEASVVLEISFNIPQNAYTGENVDTALSTTISLSSDLYTSEELITVLDIRPAAEISSNIYVGENGITDLYFTDIVLPVIFFPIGENITVVLDTRVRQNIDATISSGEYGDVMSFSTGANIGNTFFYTGENGVATLVEEENIRLYTGEYAESALSNQDTFRIEMYVGENGTAVVQSFPGEPFIVTANTGEGAQYELKTLPQINFQCYAYNSYTTHVGIPGIGTWFDLNTNCCSPNTFEYLGNHDIELNHAEEPDERFDGDKLRIDIGLSARPRFSFNVYEGTNLSAVPHDTNVNGIFGFEGQVAETSFEAVIDFNLCPGNFIPDGGNVVTELDFTDNFDCESIYAREGVTASFSLSSIAGFRGTEIYSGHNATAEVTLVSAILLLGYTGEHLFVPSSADLEPIARTGESVRFAFYEEPIFAYSGEEMSAQITIKYEVEFEQLGCLDNEYIYTDENGDEDKERFNPVPVELDPFQHDLKAVCR